MHSAPTAPRPTRLVPVALPQRLSIDLGAQSYLTSEHDPGSELGACPFESHQSFKRLRGKRSAPISLPVLGSLNANSVSHVNFSVPATGTSD